MYFLFCLKWVLGALTARAQLVEVACKDCCSSFWALGLDEGGKVWAAEWCRLCVEVTALWRTQLHMWLLSCLCRFGKEWALLYHWQGFWKNWWPNSWNLKVLRWYFWRRHLEVLEDLVYMVNLHAHLLSRVSHADLFYYSSSSLPFNTSICASVFVLSALYTFLLWYILTSQAPRGLRRWLYKIPVIIVYEMCSAVFAHCGRLALPDSWSRAYGQWWLSLLWAVPLALTVTLGESPAIFPAHCAQSQASMAH